MFKIEKNIPMPERLAAGRKTKYPFEAMEPGDSFFVPNKTKMASTVSSASRKYGKRFVYAVETDARGVEGTRVWFKPDEPEEAPQAGASEPEEPEPVKRGRVRRVK